MDTLTTKITLCESKLDHRFSNQRLCLGALQASGHRLLWQGQLLRVDKNDRLAILGDTVAKTFLCQMWYATDLSKGEWTQIEQATLRNTHLGAVGFAHGLEECLALNDGTQSVSTNMMATAVEALLGAVYLDGGYHALGQVLERLGLVPDSLQAVMSRFPIPAGKEQTALVFTLIEFLDRDIGGLQIDCKGASGPGHDGAISASHTHRQSLTHVTGLSSLRWIVRPV